MDYSLSPENDPCLKPWAEKLLALLEILLLSGIVSAAFASLALSAFLGKKLNFLANNVNTLSAFLFLDSGFTFLLLAAILRIHGERLRDIGLSWDRWKLHLSLGLALVPILFLAEGIATAVFRDCFHKYYMEQNPLLTIIHTPQQLVLFIFAALITGGVKEELQRAFILKRFSRRLGGAGLGLVLWSLVFGLGHYAQGAQGIAAGVIYGFAFGVLYLWRGSLIGPMAAHGTYDVLTLLLYWFTRGRSM
jgi:uncharacterized protein